jgi:hypothetical protein
MKASCSKACARTSTQAAGDRLRESPSQLDPGMSLAMVVHYGNGARQRVLARKAIEKMETVTGHSAK